MTLKQRWDATWCTFGVAKVPTSTFDELVAVYSESGRFYHTLKHLEECFSHFDTANRLARFPCSSSIARMALELAETRFLMYDRFRV